MTRNTFTRLIVDLVRRDGANLSLCQLAVLLSVGKRSHQSVKDIAAELNTNKSAVTRALDRLAMLGLIVRGRAMDARMVDVMATEAGMAFIQSIATQAAA